MELLTGVATQVAPSPTLYVPNLPPALVTLIQRLLSRDPVGRPPSAADVARLLGAMAQDVVAPPAANQQKPRSWGRLITGAAIVLSFAAIWAMFHHKGNDAGLMEIAQPVNGALAPRDIGQRIGEEVTVEFTVGHVERDEDSTFLYEGPPAREDVNFRLNLPQHIIASLRKRGTQSPENLNGALLRVTGRVTRSGKFSEILVSDMDQFQKLIYPEKPDKPDKPEKPKDKAGSGKNGAADGERVPEPERSSKSKPAPRPDVGKDLTEAVEDFAATPFGGFLGGVKPNAGKPESGKKPKTP